MKRAEKYQNFHRSLVKYLIIFLLAAVSGKIVAQTEINSQNSTNGIIGPLAVCYANSLSPESLYFGASGGQQTVYVSTTNNCTNYLVTESLDWVSYSKTGLTVRITASSNSGDARSGEVSIGSISLTVTQACGNYPGAAGTVYGDNSVCKGETNVNYSVSSIPNATGYVWSIPSGATIVSGYNTNSIYVNYSSGAASGNVSVYGTNACTSGSSSSLYVTVNDLPTASASSNTPVCTGATLNLYASGGSSYQWNGPNGYNSNQQYPSIPGINTSMEGTYYLTVTSAYGCSSQTSTYVDIYDALTASINGGGTTICYGVSPSYLWASPAGGTGSYSYLWYKNGVSTGVTTSYYYPGPLYSSSTFYCAVTSGSCGTVNTTTTYIGVYGNFTASISGGTSPICYNTSPGAFTATGTGGTGSYTYLWYRNGASTGVTSQSYNPGTLTAGSTFYCAVTSGSCGTVNTSTVSISVYGNLGASLSGGTSPICYNTSPGTFTATASGGTGSYSYLWYRNGVSTGVTTQTYNPGQLTSNITVYCTVSSGACGTVSTSTVSVTVRPNLTASINGGTSPICYNTSPGTFTASGSGGTGSYTYLWYRNGVSSGVTTQTYNPGLLTVNSLIYCAVTSSPCGTVNTSTVTISVQPQLSATISGGINPVCTGTSPGQLTVNPVGGLGAYDYLWYIDDQPTTVNTPSYTPPALDEITSVYCAVTSELCGSVNSAPVTFTINQRSVITVQPANSEIYPDQNASFSITATGVNLHYQWQSAPGEQGPWSSTGQDSPSLTVANASIFDTKIYRCQVSSDCGDVLTSNSVRIIVNTDYLTGEEIPSTGRTLETSKVVGTTGISNSVSQMGAAAINIPVFAAPGTNGMTPSISIFYNSQSGNGILGYGWHIGGLSSISRTGQNIYNDGKPGSVTFSFEDRFSINGERLLTQDSYGSENSVYSRESSPFARITAYGTAGNGPAYFSEETKEGVIHEYGNSSNSKTYAYNIATPYSWLISKTVDRNGNYIQYNYSRSSGETYLRSIIYTGNSNQGLLPYDSIVFRYTNRTADEALLFINGGYISRSKLLDKISVYCEGQVSRSYSFSYKNGLYSQLVQVEESDHAGNSFNPVVIDWGTNGGFDEKYESQIDRYQSDEGIETGDYNGDGADDLVVWGNNSTNSGISFYEMSNGSFQRRFENTYQLERFYSFANKDKYNTVSDMNGDGIDDLILITDDSLFVFMGSSDIQSIFDSEASIPIPGLSKFFPGDFNGDGTGEVILIGGADTLIHSFRDNQTWDVSIPASSYYKFVDINADGKTDLMTLTATGYRITEFTYNESSGQYTMSSSGTYTSTILNSANNTRMFQGDFNGDGNTDILIKGSPAWYIYYSNGNQFLTNSNYPCPVPAAFDPFTASNGHALFVRDINSDGKSDIIEISNRSGEGLAFNYRLSRGMDFKTESYEWLHSAPLVNSNDFIPGYFYGDGQLDCLYQMFRSFKFKNNDRSNQVIAVVNGLNHKTLFSYEFRVKPSAAISRPQLNALVYKSFPQFVVNILTSKGSDNVEKKKEYSYANPVVHLGGKGLLGFANQTINDKVSEFTTTTKTGVNEDHLYLYPSEQVMKDKNSNSISEQFFTDASVSYTNGSYFGYMSRIISRDVIHNLRDTINYYYDSYGNDTLTITRQNGVQVTTTRKQYIQKGSWCPSRISSVITTRSSYNSVPPYQARTGFSYDDLGRLTGMKEFSDLPDSLVTRISYNSFGNITQKRSKTGNTTARFESYGYDAKQRFATSVTRGSLVNSFEIDPATGAVTESTEPNGLVTTYTNDGFGRQTDRRISSTKFLTTNYNWSIGSPDKAIYSVTQSDGLADLTTWYDNEGKQVRSSSPGFNGTSTYIDRQYSTKNELTKESRPYFSSSSPLWNNYSYDAFGRISSSIINGATINYSYNNNESTATLQVTGANRVSTVSLNGAGQVISVTKNSRSLGFEYDNKNRVTSVTPPGTGSEVGYDYDSRALLTGETDPDRGTTGYRHNSFGELVKHENAGGDEDSVIYDHMGRDSIRIRNNVNTIYSYYTTGNGKGRLSQVSSPAGFRKYSYDIYGHVTRECDSISATETFPYIYQYDDRGRLSSVTYPGGFAVNYQYNSKGYLEYIRRASDNSVIWRCTSLDAEGKIRQYLLSGNTITVDKSYDTNGYPTRIKTRTGSTIVQLMKYSFNAGSGDLETRIDSLRSITEDFGYDVFDQLKWSKVTGQDTLKITYDDLGNIIYKSDVGQYYYNSERVHAVDSINGSQNLNRQNIEYNNFNKPVFIANDNDSLIYLYNVLDDRIKTLLYDSTGLSRTTWYAGTYEKTVSGSSTKHHYYINGPDGPVALAIQNGSETPVIYYICKDHLGSITGIMNSSGTILEEYNYDPWGKRRNPADWSYANVTEPTYTQHGFTGHEHLGMFDLINMNGRIYDSEIARFLNPDPIIQDPYNFLNYNRYTYCLNNPLKYTDPSGYTREAIQRDMEENQKNAMGSAVFYNNYPHVWSAYTNSITRGYTGGYGNFVTQYYEQVANDQVSSKSNGNDGYYITWETSYTYTNGRRQELRDAKGNLVGVILPEVGVGIERHSIFVPNPASGGDSNFLDQVAKFGDWASIGLTGPSLGTNPDLKLKPKYQPPGFNPANELKVNNAMKTASKYLDGVGKALGIISYIDHANKGFQSMQNGKIWEGLGYYGLSIIDIVIILNKSVDPYVLGTVFVYDIVDATAF